MTEIIKKDGTESIEELSKVEATKGFQFDWGGFFLGLFLGLTGFIITLFIKDSNKKNRMLSSLIGLPGGIWLWFLIFGKYFE
jgi:hypothetical protein